MRRQSDVRAGAPSRSESQLAPGRQSAARLPGRNVTLGSFWFYKPGEVVLFLLTGVPSFHTDTHAVLEPMNSALVLFAYFAMLLSPCFVAQWGDLLSFRWISALARRRRTHAAESFLVSFREERYAMALALEASFAAASNEFEAAPRPFLVQTRIVPINDAAFVQARQRVAARVAQLAVAQKLRNESETPKKVVALPGDVPVPASSVGVHIRPRKGEFVAAQSSFAPAFREYEELQDQPVYQEPIAERAAASAASSPGSPGRPIHLSEPVPTRISDSGGLERAA